MIGRRMLLLGAGAALTVMLMPRSLAQLADVLRPVFADHFGDRRPKDGGVELEVSRLVENGNSVAVAVRALDDGPEPVALHLFMPRNPEPWGGSVRLQAPVLPELRTRIRLAGSQDLTAVVERADGSLGATAVTVMVTLGACADDLYGDFVQ